MGKKLSQASVKISKNDKKQLTTLIKVLKPKVYITDSSSFKTLVQELTGNNTLPTPISSNSPPPPPPPPIPAATVINVEQDHIHGYQESSPNYYYSSSELSAVQTSSFTPFDYYCSPEDQVLAPPTVLDELESDLSQCKNIESWLLDIDPFVCNYHQGLVPMYEYDDLSATLIM